MVSVAAYSVTEVVVLVIMIYAASLIMILSQMIMDVQLGRTIRSGLWKSVPLGLIAVLLSLFAVRIATVSFILGIETAYIAGIFIRLIGMMKKVRHMREESAQVQAQPMQQEYAQW